MRCSPLNKALGDKYSYKQYDALIVSVLIDIVMSTKDKIQLLLHFLNSTKTRATYKAVAEVTGLSPVGVSNFLGAPRPFASWVVSSNPKNNFMPSGYELSDIAPELFDSPVLMNGDELLAAIGKE